MNTPQPSAGRNQAARSQEYKVCPIREPTAIAASKACRPFNDQHRFQDPHPLRGQHQQCPLAVVAAVMSAAVAPAVASAAVVVVMTSANFNSYDFQNNFADENKTIRRIASGSNAGNGTGLDVAHLRLCARGADFQFTKRRRQRVGGGSHKS
jgi:hypothetical protein